MTSASSGSIVVNSLFTVAPIVCGAFCGWSLFCNEVVGILLSFVIIVEEKRAGCFTLIVFLQFLWLLMFCKGG